MALILGIPVDDVTMEETVDRIFELVADGRQRGTTHQIATTNVNFIVNALSDADLRPVIQRTSLSIPDGMPIVWGARLLGSPLRTRVAGSDLVTAIAERATRTGSTVSLFGAAPGIADRAAAMLSASFPGLRVFGDSGPQFDDVDELTIGDLAALAAVRADICCVAFGNPKQEMFIARFGGELGIPVMVGVGATLDFLVGHKLRAPQWMQRTGLEWLHRVLSEPRRLAQRYLHDAIIFFPRLMRQAWSGRRSRYDGDVRIRHGESGQLVIDLSDLEMADNRTASAITEAIRRARATGQRVEVLGASLPPLANVPGLDEIVRLAAD